jgi:hypothetical protein
VNRLDRVPEIPGVQAHFGGESAVFGCTLVLPPPKTIGN